MKKNGIRARLMESQLHELIGGRFGKPIGAQALSKLNLRLKVVGRRADGYHLLSMLNCSTSLSDDVEVRFREDPTLSLDLSPAGILLEDSESNLAVRAFRAFWRAFDFEELPVGAAITIFKRIPVGAGLGGGSSDAAAVLRILSSTFKTFLQCDFGLSDASFEAAVQSAALACGADVPYALYGGLCRVSGVGETVKPVVGAHLERQDVIIAVPATPVPTKAFYQHYRAAHPEIAMRRDEALETFVSKPSRGLEGLLENDFEPDILAMAPEVGRALAVLREALPGWSGITGSGCAVFGLLPGGGKDEALQIAEKLRRLPCVVHQVRVMAPRSSLDEG